MKMLALWAIRLYQRFISPHKGFCCAYAAHTGHASCSTFAYRAIRRFGVAGGIKLLNFRLHKCGVAYRRYQITMGSVLARQAGFCDLDCGAGGDCGELPCGDLADCAFDLPCEIGSGKRKNKKCDRDVKLPPRRSG